MSVAPASPTVLVADADADVRARYQRVLRETGCVVIEAGDGLDALQKALQRAPSLVIADLDLPTLNGALLCELLRHAQATRDAQVLLVTQESQPASLARARNAGASGLLTKPSLDDVLQQSRRLLKHAQELRRETTQLSQQSAHEMEISADLRARSAEQRRLLFEPMRGVTRRPGNRVLAALSDADFEAVSSHLTRVPLRAKQVLHHQGQPLERFYFPNGGMVSLVTMMSDGTMVEAATVGRQGIVGLPALFAQELTSPFESIVQVGDSDAMVLAAEDLRRGLAGLRALHTILEAEFRSLLAQVLQSNACNALHPVQQRFARWLLTTQDCVHQDEMHLSHEFLAQMLAVQRPTVSEVAADFQEAGLIQYRRGRIRVIDRDALERKSCECYAIVRGYRERLRRHLD